MAHAFQRFIQQQMDARQWTQAQLVRASGLSRAHISKLVTDGRDRLPQLPDVKTVEAIAVAFNLDPARVMLVAIRAAGVEDVPDQQFVYGVRDASNEELLAVLAERLRGGEGSGDTAPKTGPGGKPGDSEVVELRAAYQDGGRGSQGRADRRRQDLEGEAGDAEGPEAGA